MRIVFFGTPEFAVPSLRAVIGEGFDLVAVVTQPDKPQGRNRSALIPPPVKSAASETGIAVLQPAHPNDSDFVEEFRDLEPDIGVVVAYGHILKSDLLAVPKHGFMNVHASLLPKLRGAAPIQHALLQGLKETGISIMQIDKGMDSGPVMQQIPTPIAEDETWGELSVRMAELGALALVEGLQLIELDAGKWEPQDHSQATFAPKITRETARVDWTKPADGVSRLVRAMDPYPGAWTELNGLGIKLFGPAPADNPSRPSKPGTILEAGPAFIVAAGDGAVQFLDLQPAGKKRMAATEWTRGQRTIVGQTFA